MCRLELYDLVAIQELRDEEVVDRTLQLLTDRSDPFQAVISPPVGRGVKERYAFLYRPDKIQLLGPERLYPDPDDAFIREPFWASFRAGQFDFTLVTMHSIFGDSETDRRAEALLLDDLYQQVQDADPVEQGVMLLGDFNLPPDDSGFAELAALLTPLFTGEIRTTISDASLYDNIWFDSAYVREGCSGAQGTRTSLVHLGSSTEGTRWASGAPLGVGYRRGRKSPKAKEGFVYWGSSVGYSEPLFEIGSG